MRKDFCASDPDREASESRRAFLKGVSAATIWVGTSGMSGGELKAGEDGEERKVKKATGTAFIYDDAYLRHSLGPTHPESPQRLKDIMARLKATGVDKQVKMIRPSGDPTEQIKAVHSAPHIALAGRQAKDDAICRLAVSGGLRAVDEVCSGKARNAFCAVRPPGHHAENNGEFGFCFYNNVAIAARYAQKKYKLQRVLIVDWDYHHGNGTEWSFYEDPSVLFFSTHKLTAFPQTGHAGRTGAGKGKGFNINVPLKRAATDKDILNAFTQKLAPEAEKFKPDLVLISAGFDSRKGDLLGDFAVTDDGFTRLTKLMMSIAGTHARARVVSLLEGGYNTKGLALAVEAHVKALLDG